MSLRFDHQWTQKLHMIFEATVDKELFRVLVHQDTKPAFPVKSQIQGRQRPKVQTWFGSEIWGKDKMRPCGGQVWLYLVFQVGVIFSQVLTLLYKQCSAASINAALNTSQFTGTWHFSRGVTRNRFEWWQRSNFFDACEDQAGIQRLETVRTHSEHRPNEVINKIHENSTYFHVLRW